MIEIRSETRPAIPAVLRLRARYRGRRAAYAADKMRRNQHMGLFSRPTWGDRMDKAAQAKAMPKGSWKEAVAKEESADYERRTRRAKANYEKTQPYRGSKTEASHRGWFGKK